MKNWLKVILLLFFTNSWTQTDYSNNWEAFFSYNNVKDFVKVDANGEITIPPDITNFTLSTEKEVTNITEYNNKLYLSTPFAIVEYDIENLVFGDTFFIDNNSSEIKINQITIHQDIIYVATKNGVYTADINNPNLIDFNNWTQNFSGNYGHQTLIL